MTAATAGLRAPRTASDYSDLMAKVQQARLLDRAGTGYLPRALTLGALFSAGLLAFVWLGSSWWQIAVAAGFAVLFAQLGFLGHDAAHQQIFRSRRWNDLVGTVVSNAGIGLSYRWWVDKHTAHHRHPNDVEHDPDVQRSVLAWTPEQVSRQRGLLRVIARHQAVLFFPLLLLEAVNLHVGSVRMLASRPREHRAEICLLVLHAAGYLTLVLFVLSPLKALVFVLAQQGLFGLYLGCSFAPNHKGMHLVGAGEELDFLRRQVLTSRNVSGGRALAAALGSLNYQIEHHLFPSMPSRNLRRCQPLVRDFCAARGVPYCETSLVVSYARTLRYLRALRPGGPRIA